MQAELMNTLGRLTGAFGPSGREEAAATLVEELIAPFVDEVRRDRLGSVIAIRRGSAAGKVMLLAPLDQVGGLITHVDDRGFARFAPVGKYSAAAALGQRVRFADGSAAVIGGDLGDEVKELRTEHLHVDLGLAGGKPGARVGDMFVFAGAIESVAGGLLWGSALGNRAAALALIETARRLPKGSGPEVSFVFAAHGEVGQRGARTATFVAKPDLAVVVAPVQVGETPKGPKNELKLGSGPALKLKDQTFVSHAGVRRLLEAAAAGTPHQLEVSGGSGQAPAIEVSGEGVPVGAVSLPVRYGGPVEGLQPADLEQTILLLAKFLAGPLTL